MSAFSACSRRWIWGLAIVTVLTALGALALAGAAMARVHAHGDSARVAKRVVISDEGVEIVGGDDSSDRPAVDIRVGRDFVRQRIRARHGLRESTDAVGGVRVVGPGIVIGADEAGLVRVFADAEVPAGKRVEGDVVAVFGSVTVRGEVAGDVVAVGGSVRLDPGAAVEGDVVTIGGALDQAQGANVGGESVSLGCLPIACGVPTLPALLLAVLACSLVSLFVGWLLALVFPERMLRVAATASHRTAGSFALGFFALPLMFLTAIVLAITVVGIPISLLLWVMVWGGQLAATCVIGSKIMRRPLDQGGLMLPLLVGTLFIAMFFAVGAVLAGPPGVTRTAALFFGLLGVLLVAGLSAIGAGAVLLSRIGGRPADVRFRAVTEPTGMPGPPAGAAPPPASPAG